MNDTAELFDPTSTPHGPVLWTPPPTGGARRPRRTRHLALAGAGLVGVAGLTAGTLAGFGSTPWTSVVAGHGTAAATADGSAGTGSGSSGSTGGSGSSGSSGGFGPWGGWGSGSGGSNGSGSSGSGSSGSSSSGTTGTATAAQSAGVVDITTVLGYNDEKAAGTGMVVTSNGEILTNNHVVDGATSITVVVVSTGASYTGHVVGTDPTADVAVVQLDNAHGLTKAKTGTVTASVGERVTAVGNAGGTGGTPSSATGQVTALDQSITASDEGGGNAENLTGLVQTDADIQAGDSGGPLYDATTGTIIGMDTAASSGGQVTEGYAIPIGTALAVAHQIEGGVDNATVHQGYPAFLGVQVSPNGDGGATIAGVVQGLPADQAGLTAGDVITAVDATAIGSADELSATLAKDHPGQRVSLSWTDTSGASQSATVTLVQGPAD